jgi:ribosomal protein S8
MLGGHNARICGALLVRAKSKRRGSPQVGTPTARTASTAEHHQCLPAIFIWVLWKELGPLGWVQNGKDNKGSIILFCNPKFGILERIWALGWVQNAQKNSFKTRKKSLLTRAKVKNVQKYSFKTRKKTLSERAKVSKRAKKLFQNAQKLKTCKKTISKRAKKNLSERAKVSSAQKISFNTR